MTTPSEDPLALAIKVKPVVAELGRATATHIARHAGLRIEPTYMGLVRLHEMGLAKITLGKHEAGRSKNQWELR
jgi:hypothetical protein